MVQTSVVPREKENVLNFKNKFIKIDYKQIGPNAESSAIRRSTDDINETGESSMKRQTEKNVKSVISWVK